MQEQVRSTETAIGDLERFTACVDKRILSHGRDAVRLYLKEFIPLIEEGGFIPAVDHTIPPEVSWDDFRMYMDMKIALLNGDFNVLN